MRFRVRALRRAEIIWMLPLSVLFLTAILHFSLVLRMEVRLTEAARAGALFAASAPADDPRIMQEIVPILPFWLNQDHLTIAITPPPAARTGGSALRVELRYSLEAYRAPIPVGLLLGIPQELSSAVVVPVVEAGGRPAS